MKPFILFQFITSIAAFARQLLLSIFCILSFAAISYGQNNFIQNPQYTKAKIDISHLAAL